MSRKSIIDSLLKMRKLAVPGSDCYSISTLTDPNIPGRLSNIFRVFSPINPTKGRKPNTEFGFDFDKNSDILSDSPVTIGAKMGANWEIYNQHAIVQVGICNFRCWYCYVDYKHLKGKSIIRKSSSQIMEEFLKIRKQSQSKRRTINVLRISGGEPMLAPELVLSCLRKIRHLGLDHQICIKTETNMSPLMNINGHSLAEEWADLKELAQYRNFLLHTTIHGISPQNLKHNSAVESAMFDMVLEGMETFIRHRIDFFPSFGANTVHEKDIELFFHKLIEINENLPLRFAVRAFNFDYKAISERNFGRRKRQISNPAGIIRKWDSLLRNNYGLGYGDIPRYKVQLY